MAIGKLPEELEEEILLRMPVKSLLRLKCVCKSWFSIISNPNFAKSHLQLSPNHSQQPNRILLTTSPQLRSIDINTSLHDDSDTINLDFPPLADEDDGVRIFGSCRGFVLLLVKQKDFFIWNPVTGSHRQISLPPQCEKLRTLSPFAFCYDESIDDYFIGLSYINYYFHPPLTDWFFEVLSLKTNSWERIGLSKKHYFRTEFPGLGTMLNGAIHFTVYRREFQQVIAFNMTTKDARELPHPICSKFGCGCAELGVHEGGFLALIVETLSALTDGREIGQEIQVWVMREYGVKSSWTKLISVPSYHHHIGMISYFIPSLVVYKEEGFVTGYLGRDDVIGEGLAKLNYKGQVVEHKTYGVNNLLRKRPPEASRVWTPYFVPTQYWRPAIAYTQTLLPLP